jgi:hypothetical protein
MTPIAKFIVWFGDEPVCPAECGVDAFRKLRALQIETEAYADGPGNLGVDPSIHHYYTDRNGLAYAIHPTSQMILPEPRFNRKLPLPDQSQWRCSRKNSSLLDRLGEDDTKRINEFCQRLENYHIRYDRASYGGLYRLIYPLGGYHRSKFTEAPIVPKKMNH